MNILSSKFKHNQPIPTKFTCHGQDVSPELYFENIPKTAQCLALVFTDPDAPAGSANPGWVHWMVYNINPQTTLINQGSTPPDLSQGQNDWGRNDYGGPCPPSGTHRYVFTLYALDKNLKLPSGLSKSELMDNIKNHIIESAQLIGLVSA